MILLVLVGFLAGLVTGISPCILPVLPVIFAVRGGQRPGRVGSHRLGHSRHRPGSPCRRRSAPVTEGAATDGPATCSRPVGPGPPERHVPTGPGGGAVARPRPSCGSTPRRRRRRPFAVVAGLVLSFSVFTLLGSWLLERPRPARRTSCAGSGIAMLGRARSRTARAAAGGPAGAPLRPAVRPAVRSAEGGGSCSA